MLLRDIRDLIDEFFVEEKFKKTFIKINIFNEYQINKLFEAVSDFLAIIASKDITFTEEDKAAIIILIFPEDFGSSTKKEIKEAAKENRVYKALGEDGVRRYKRTITVNNSKKLRDKFFSQDSVIRKIWPFIRENLTKERLFPKFSVEKLIRTCPEVTKDMIKYGLPMPEWWQRTFNSKF